MNACRAVADAGSVTPALYKSAQEGITRMVHLLRSGGDASGAGAASKTASRKGRAAQGRQESRKARNSRVLTLPDLEEEEEDEEAEEDDAGRNHDRCHRCCKGGKLICCAVLGCRRSWHKACLPSDAMDTSGDEDDWKCPKCTKSKEPVSSANPKSARALGRPKQNRYRSASEGRKKPKA